MLLQAAGQLGSTQTAAGDALTTVFVVAGAACGSVAESAGPSLNPHRQLHKFLWCPMHGALVGLRPAHVKCTDPQFCAAQVLHVAVLRKQQAAVEALLELGLSPTVHNSRRWTPLDEAVSLRETALVRPLYLRRVADTKAELKAKKALLMESLGSMPDYTMKVCCAMVLKTVCW